MPRKGHDVLLRALARLFDLDWQLTIVGSADRDPVHARALAAAGRGIRHRAARALCRRGERGVALEALWHEADLFALATHWEGYGMAIAEALKRGVPVAVSAGGAAGNLVTPESGVVCPAGDHINLSKALRRMIFGAGTASRDGGSGVAGWSDAAGLADAGAGIRPGAGGVTEGFAADWLALREPFDHAARSVALARRLADRLPQAAAAGGSRGGTGSMFRFLAPIIGRGQDWILLDADGALLDDAFGRTAAWARRQGFAATAAGDELLGVDAARAVADAC